jgi:hypothetical protein
MSLYALVSAGGSPGVTTSSLALALGWPSQVIVAECDPSGGDVLAGLFGGHLPASTGLLPLAIEAGRSADAAVRALWGQLIDLDDERSRLLLAGISDPRQAVALAPSWPALAAALAAVPADVIADCGRLDAAPAVAPVLAAARRTVLVLRPSLRQVSKARQRIELLTDLLGGRQRLALLIVGEGTHAARDVSRVLGVPVAAVLPDDKRTALVLSDGAGNRRGLATRPLVRAATGAGRALREALTSGLEPTAEPPPASELQSAAGLLPTAGLESAGAAAIGTANGTWPAGSRSAGPAVRSGPGRHVARPGAGP